MAHFLWFTFISTMVFSAGCLNSHTMKTYQPSNTQIKWNGRHFAENAEEYFLVGSASSLKFRFGGNKCTISLAGVVGPDQTYAHNISWVLDGVHSSMFPVQANSLTPLEITVPTNKEYHDLEIFKESEPSCGFVRIGKIEVENILPLNDLPKKRIEFIGNSITAGMSADPSRVPCGEGGPCDQHNAYESYGPTVARILNLDFAITAVSGIGVYRNFATDFPTMSDVYENTLLTSNQNDFKWDFTFFIPDIVCINLGTNDFSDGGGPVPREPFDSTQFINKYNELLEIILKHYPNTKIVLLQHAMSGSHNISVFSKCLSSIKQHFHEIHPKTSIEIFIFSPSTATGCLGHPGLDEHKRMADELSQFLDRFD